MYNVMPCKDCKERYLGCHDKCEKYLNAKKLLKELKHKERLEKQVENDVWESCKIPKRRVKSK